MILVGFNFFVLTALELPDSVPPAGRAAMWEKEAEISRWKKISDEIRSDEK